MPNNTRRNILFILLGLVAGLIIGTAISVYLLRDTILSSTIFQIPKTKDFKDIKISGDELIPQIKIGIPLPKNLVSEEYHALINNIVNTEDKIAKNNNDVLIPLMTSLQQKSMFGDFRGLFDLAFQAKIVIKDNESLIIIMRDDINSLNEVNQSIIDSDIRDKTTIFLMNGNTLNESFQSYFNTMNKFLTGSLPTQKLLDELDKNINTLEGDVEDFKQSLVTLLQTIKEKNEEGS